MVYIINLHNGWTKVYDADEVHAWIRCASRFVPSPLDAKNYEDYSGGSLTVKLQAYAIAQLQQPVVVTDWRFDAA